MIYDTRYKAHYDSMIRDTTILGIDNENKLIGQLVSSY
jgi:hypothetical protein